MTKNNIKIYKKVIIAQKDRMLAISLFSNIKGSKFEFDNKYFYLQKPHLEKLKKTDIDYKRIVE